VLKFVADVPMERRKFIPEAGRHGDHSSELQHVR
jgi:hypothetical protein